MDGDIGPLSEVGGTVGCLLLCGYYARTMRRSFCWLLRNNGIFSVFIPVHRTFLTRLIAGTGTIRVPAVQDVV